MQSRLTAFCAVALILLLGTSDLFAQRNQTAEYYSVTESDFVYEALTRDNTEEFWDLSDEEEYTGAAGTGRLIGDYDEGAILVGPFLNVGSLLWPFDWSFMGEGGLTGGAITTNGGIELIRATNTGSGTLTGNPLWNPSGAGYYNNSMPFARIFAFQGDLDMTADDAKILMGTRDINGKTYLIIEWQNAEFFFVAGGPISFQLFISNDSFTPEIHVVYGDNASTIPSQYYYTGLNDGTAVNGTNVDAKDYDGDPGNYIGARWEDGEWQSTSDASETGGLYATFGDWPSKNIRFCLAPDITAEVEDATIFDYTNNDDDIVAADAELSKTYRVSNPATSDEPIKVTMDVIGANANSFSVDPPGADAIAPGTSQIFDITFKPAGFGEQEAEITVGVTTMDGADCPVVKPSATLDMLGLVPGLTAIDEDPLVDFGEVGVNSNTWRMFDLFTNESPGDIKYTFDGSGLAGTEFLLTDGSGNPANTYTAIVGPGENASVPVRFVPTLQGVQGGTLEITYSDVNDEIFSNPIEVEVIGDATPTRIELLINNEGNHAPDGTILGRNGVAAVGEVPSFRYFTITNTGAVGAINIENFMFYELNRSEQVDGRFQVRWTEGFGNGMPLRSKDFYVERDQNGSWVPVNEGNRITLGAKEGVDLRVVFAPQRPGFKYVRMFFNTDATVDQNFRPVETLNPADELTPQLLSYELYGFGARNGQILELASVEFDDTEVGNTSELAALEIKNTGDSRLLIDINSIRLWPGDDDFTIADIFPEQERTEQGKAIIPIDESGFIYLNFTPKRAGTRFTSLYFQSNDSTPTPDGLIGERYVTVYGVGTANARLAVDAGSQPLFDGLSAIVDDPSTYETANITLTHEGGPTLVITNLRFEGPDADDYQITSIDNLGPIDELGSRTITVQFAPMSAGAAKVASLIIESNAAQGDRMVQLTGIADTRLISAPAGTLFTTVTIGTGEDATESVLIENVGTVELDLQAPNFSNPADYSSDYSGGTIPVGGSVTINVTLNSSTSEGKSGTMTINNNSTNENQVEIPLAGYVGLRRPDAQRSFGVSADWIRGNYVPETVNIDVTNIGDLPLTLDPAGSNFTGAGADQFSIIDIPTDEIAPNNSVTVVVEYAPTSGTSAQATLNLASNGDPNPLTIDFNGTVTDVVEQARAAGYELLTSAPNPVQGKATIGYSIPSLQQVSIELFDMRGTLVAVLVNQQMPAGSHSVTVDCTDLPAGNYVYKLSTDAFDLSQNLQVLR